MQVLSARDLTHTTTLNTLIAAMWNAQGYRRTLSPDPSEIDPAPDEVSALSHAQQPERARSILFALGNPSAVIPDLEDSCGPFLLRCDVDPGRLSVTEHIAQGFLKDSERTLAILQNPIPPCKPFCPSARLRESR